MFKNKKQYYLLKLKKLGFKSIFLKLLKRIYSPFINSIKRNFTFYYKIKREHGVYINESFINVNDLNTTKINKNVAKLLANNFLSHKFDLLGSGWVEVSYDLNPNGLEGYKYDCSPRIKKFDCEGQWLTSILRKCHIDFGKKIWRRIDKDYKPIDWQIDYKSGFRWSSKGWYKDQRKNIPIGADIKVPWELSRFQHLPKMAILSMKLEEYRVPLIREFKNQILDFIMTNPPGMGVNWNCSMDIGIRASNIVVAYDIFRQLDDENILDEEFEMFVSNSIYEHGRHLTKNFEWTKEKTNNHYLGNISGLLFIASYLNETRETNAWLLFSIQELICEMEKQFNFDGTNFESSTNYHRLSGEMIVYSTALIYGLCRSGRLNFKNGINHMKRLLPLNKQKFNIYEDSFFSKDYLEKLYLSGIFTADITKENGEVFQIGDNDSGRFFHFSPVGDILTTKEAVSKYQNITHDIKENPSQQIWDENYLIHGTYISAINGLFKNECFLKYSKEFPLEKSIIESLSKNKKITICPPDSKRNIFENKKKLELNNLSRFKETIIKNKSSVSLLSNIQLKCYRDFGIYIFKSKVMHLVVFQGCDDGLDGHTHNDKLSFCLNLNGEDIFIDKGSYVYTPLPNKRDVFRSVCSHNVPVVSNLEQNEFIAPFIMKRESFCSLIDCSESSISLFLEYKGVKHLRRFKIEDDKIVIKDYSNKNFTLNFVNAESEYSNGYGKLLHGKS